MTDTPIAVGDRLYVTYTDRRRGESYEVTVTKVGRVWIETALTRDGWTAPDYRFAKDTLYADGKGYSSPARAWRSREAYDANVRRSRVLTAIRGAVEGQWWRLKDVPDADLIEAARLLRVEVPAVPATAADTPENSLR